MLTATLMAYGHLLNLKVEDNIFVYVIYTYKYLVINNITNQSLCQTFINNLTIFVIQLDRYRTGICMFFAYLVLADISYTSSSYLLQLHDPGPYLPGNHDYCSRLHIVA